MYTEIIFHVACAVVGVTTLVIARYLVPWLKLHITQQQAQQIEFWANKGTYYAQQFLGDSPSLNRKEAVFGFLRTVRDEQKLPFTDDQIEVLIEAAVKQLKMDEETLIEIEDDEEWLDEDDNFFNVPEIPNEDA